MLLTRVITAAIALAVFLAALFFLPPALWAVLLLIVLGIGAWEWAGLSGYARAARVAYAGLLVLSALALFYGVPRLTSSPQTVDLAVFIVSGIFWVAVAPFWLAQRWKYRNRWLLGLVGWIVLVPMWLALVRLQPSPWALLIFMSVVWIADTAAYGAGRTWGRNKLAPQISPGKTWEGAYGALAAVALYFGALSLLTSSSEHYVGGVWGLVLFMAMVVLSIEGDLFESWMKRQAGLKDSGHILPGHGGILDRVDGLTAAMPAAALAVYLR